MSKDIMNGDNNEQEDILNSSDTEISNEVEISSKREVLQKKHNKKLIAIITTASVVIALLIAYIVITIVKPNFFKHLFDSNYVMKIDYKGQEIIIDDMKYQYWFNSYKYNLDGGNNAYWTADTATSFQAVKDYAEYATKLYTVPYLLADEYGIVLDDDDYAEIDKTLQADIKEAEGQEKFDQLLAANKIDLETYKYFLTSDYLKEILMEEYKKKNPVDEKDIFKKYDEEYAVVKHILLSEDSLKDKDDILEKITKEVYDMAKGDEKTFEELIKEYNTDPGMAMQPDGYFVTDDGQYVEAFEKGALGLKIGEVSKPIETNYGYHIIKRYDPAKFYKANKETLISMYYSDKFTLVLQDVLEELDKNTTYANYYSDMEPDQFED